MPPLVPVPRFNVIRVKAQVSDNSKALITMSYHNQKAPNENFTLGHVPAIDKAFVFDEVGFHSLVFLATSEATKGSLRITLTDRDHPGEPLYDSGAVPLKDGHAAWEVRVRPR